MRLARALVPGDEVRNHKLGTLAAHFGATTTPNHRALADARATVDVLHALLARAGSLGVTSREDLIGFSARVPAARRRRASMADGLPQVPGVYVFKDESGMPLYVGTSGNIHTRVRSYFTASEKRRGMGLMVDLATHVTPIPCATPLEAHVREIRLIAEHRPRFNRRSKNPEKVAWLKLTDEPFPRLSVVRTARLDAATYVGPFTSTAAARSARDVVHEVTRLRQCTGAITRTSTACALAELDRCDAPCTGAITRVDYGALVDRARDGLLSESTPWFSELERTLAHLAAQERFEEARARRDAMLDLLRGLDRHQRRAPLLANPSLVAARAAGAGSWEFVVVKHGRLAGSARSESGTDPRPVIDALRSTAAQVEADSVLTTLPEETDVVLRWLQRPGVRVVDTEQPWCSPVHGATGPLSRLEPLVRRAHDAEWEAADARWSPRSARR